MEPRADGAGFDINIGMSEERQIALNRAVHCRLPDSARLRVVHELGYLRFSRHSLRDGETAGPAMTDVI
jgi:hypothetical protein